MPDPRSRAALDAARSSGIEVRLAAVDCASVYLIEAPLEPSQVARLAAELLADPVCEEAFIGSSPARADALIEVHPLPGVMDPDAEAVEVAIRALLGVEATVRTGRRYDFHGATPDDARQIARRSLANGVIHDVHVGAFVPAAFPVAEAHAARVREIGLADLDDGALERLSRSAHLFLSLDEMRAIRDEYRRLGRNPREIELETLAQTWSEHCVHKTLKATIAYRGELPDPPRGEARPGHERCADGSIRIRNLLASTVAAATRSLIADGIDWCLSVFTDNSGVIAFDADTAVCFKVETHNHPSAIEPYGGAATGIGGCIRDVIGTGLGAKPIAATDVFCVAHPDHWERAGVGARKGTGTGRRTLPEGCLDPRRILREVVSGVRDYGNRMGIPTLNGAVWFDDDYVGNPLVYCGCVGVLPRWAVSGKAIAGDQIVAIGGRTGRDGIHGATFSSAQLTDTHADEFSHAVQIGNAVTEKKMLDAILAARDAEEGCLYHAITDCGAGGFSSAIGEMGETLGAEVHLDRAPLKYAGLSPAEIWISEAQERMVLAVPREKLDRLRAICAERDVELSDLGHFGTKGRELILLYCGDEVGRLPMAFLHEGLPGRVREAEWTPVKKQTPPLSPADRSSPALRAGWGERQGEGVFPALDEALLALLAHPNIASKHWIVRQYDHEVQGGSVIKPLVGARGEGPGDAAVIVPVAGSRRGLAIGCGLATGWRDDPYLMALAAIDECVRNLVSVGSDPARIAILDNFCWPSCDDPRRLGELVRAAEGCHDGAIAYRAPFISGKDSLNNQFSADGTTIAIPPTLLISGFAIVPDVERCVTSDLKRAGNVLVLVGDTGAQMRGSHFDAIFGGPFDAEADELPAVDLVAGPRTAHAVADLIARGLVAAAHDCSEGGLLVAAAEMAIGGGLGVEIDLDRVPARGGSALDATARAFAETPSRYLIEMDPRAAESALRGVSHAVVGTVTREPRCAVRGGGCSLALDDLRAAWRATLDW